MSERFEKIPKGPVSNETYNAAVREIETLKTLKVGLEDDLRKQTDIAMQSITEIARLTKQLAFSETCGERVLSNIEWNITKATVQNTRLALERDIHLLNVREFREKLANVGCPAGMKICPLGLWKPDEEHPATTDPMVCVDCIHEDCDKCFTATGYYNKYRKHPAAPAGINDIIDAEIPPRDFDDEKEWWIIDEKPEPDIHGSLGCINCTNPVCDGSDEQCDKPVELGGKMSTTAPNNGDENE